MDKLSRFQEDSKTASESEERFKLIFERSADPTFLIDGDRFVDCNEAALKFMDCSSRDQLTGVHPSSISPELQPDGKSSSEKVKECIDAALREGAVRFEWKHQSFRGAELWVDVSLSVIPLGGKQVIYTVWRDITDRKKMEENLAAQARRFLALVENAPFGAMLLDRDRKCTYTNAKFRELFGYDLEDVPDQQVWLEKAYPDPEYRSSVIATWHNEIEKFSKNSSIREGEHWTFTVTCKNGRQKIANVIPVQLPTGEYLKTYADITEQKKAEEALKSREAELAAKSASLQDVNAALRVLLNERERDRMELEEKIASNVDKLVLPYVKELKKCHLDPPGMSYVEAIETGLDHIVSPFLQRLTVRCGDLTPREMKIADLVKTGKTTKEIGQLLRMTPGAVNFHRNNIRKKLGLNNRRVNLTSYLSSLK